MTPLEIQICLHYHCSNADYPNRDFPAWNEVTQRLVALGLLSRNHYKDCDADFSATDRCRAYCHMLENTQIPVQMWMNPETNEAIYVKK